VRVWYAKMLVRIARGDLESKYRRVELLFQALENYFKLRGLWYRGPKAGLPWFFTNLDGHYGPARCRRLSVLARATMNLLNAFTRGTSLSASRVTRYQP
jgi:hypothetical protein